MAWGVRIEGCVIDPGWWARDFAVVGWRIEVDDVKSVFEKSYTWNKGFSLDTISV